MQRVLGLLGQIPAMGKVVPGFVILLIILSLIYMRFGYKIGNIVAIGLVIIILLLLGLNLIVKWRQKRKEASFDHELQKRSEEQSVSKIEIQRARAELSQRWNAAVSELKKSGMTLYSLPWYMLVGEPQSGKTTTLISSEIEFPVGTECLSGVGGTRNCDWFFTNEAVILDTAGRFTFQEKNAPDHEEWKSFLNLLKNHRASCPINGVIVVIPATSLLEDSPEEQEQKAKNIRQKLIHIQEVLEVRFPVFILVTKCDRILGFTEFFSRLGAAQQRQLFGWSNQASFEQPYNPEDGFTEVFKKLCHEIHRWRLKFIGEGINLNLIDKLFVFPEEFQALQKPFQEYLNTIFIQDRFHEPLFFRGFYFSSGLQQGRPVAKACRELLGGGEVDKQVIEELEQVFQKSRAFFIRDFYKKKVFPEQELVIRSAKAQKRDSLIRYLVLAGGGTIAVISLALLLWGVV
ncbi:MAG: type VI secretion protein IcmF/TssM N-terminal domain-containing protein, partial [Candidatus Desantisbacteria bacterium]